MIRFFRNKKGLTLVEVILALGLGAVILTSMSMALNSSLNSWKGYNEKSEALQHARIAMNRMMTEIRYAESLVLSNGNEIIFDTTTLVDDDPLTIEQIRYWWNSGEVIRRYVDGQPPAGDYICGEFYAITDTVTHVRVINFNVLPLKLVAGSLVSASGDLPNAVAVEVLLTIEDKEGDQVSLTSMVMLRNA